MIWYSVRDRSTECIRIERCEFPGVRILGLSGLFLLVHKSRALVLLQRNRYGQKNWTHSLFVSNDACRVLQIE